MNIIQFNYIYKNNYDDQDIQFTYPIQIPFVDDINELGYQIANEMNIQVWEPCFPDLFDKIKRFIEEHKQKYYNSRDEDLLNKARNGQIDLDCLIKDTEKKYKNEILEFADRIGPTDEEIFAHSFHRLVHSSLLPDVLLKEKSYANEVTDIVDKMDKEIESITDSQQQEMESQLQQLDVSITSDDINALLSRQYSLLNMVRKKYESELEAKKGHQKHQYRDWVISEIGNEILCPTLVPPTYIGNKSSMFVSLNSVQEESFTIHLGSQLKHMHNIRILSGDVNELCSSIHTDESDLNMALGLYSSSLCAVVVLTPSGSIQINNKILKNALMSAEFHFDQITDQIEQIQNELQKIKGIASPTKDRNIEKSLSKLKSGDFFITRHSNLSQAHLIFHLITDEPFTSPNEINSRHPVILGLRNILKVASRYDVTMLTIPALLRHDMSEDMTVSWCIRRAELIFKCTKGFMIESATWGGAELNTLQLLLPNDISEELFGTLVAMIPHVFRVVNPKIFKNTSKSSDNNKEVKK